MSLEYIDIGNPGAPNTDPTTGQPYNPNHLLIPAHINQPGGVLVIFNNSTNDLFFTFVYNRYRIKVPATQKRQIKLLTPEPQGISYAVGTATAIIVGQPDVYIETYAPDECVPPFDEGASGVAVASAGIPVTIAAAKGTVLTSTAINHTLADVAVIDTLAPAAGLYAWVYTVRILDNNATPYDALGIEGGNLTDAAQPFWTGKLTQFLGNGAVVWTYANGTSNTPKAFYTSALEQTYAAEGDELQFNVGVATIGPGNLANPASVRVDAALVLIQPY